MALNDPSRQCYILILPDTNDSSSLQHTVRFQTMPDKITDSKSATYNDAQIIGRSSPLKTYQFSSARKISLTLEFFASLEAKDIGGKTGGEAANVVKGKVNLLRGLVNPNYGSKLIARPRRCLVRMGQSIGMVGFCTSVNVVLRGDYPWELNPALAHHASVSMTFEDTGEQVYSFDDIRIGRDFNDNGVPTQYPNQQPDPNDSGWWVPDTLTNFAQPTLDKPLYIP